MNSLSETGETSVRTVRVPDELWREFRRTCTEKGFNASQMLRTFMEWTVQQERKNAEREGTP